MEHIGTDIASLHIGHLHLSPRTTNALVNAGKTQIGILAILPDDELFRISGLGTTGVNEIHKTFQLLKKLYNNSARINWSLYHQHHEKSRPIGVYFTSPELDTLPEKVIDIPIGHLYLDGVAENALCRLEIGTLQSLISNAKQGIPKQEKFGDKAIADIMSALFLLSKSIQNNSIDWNAYWQSAKVSTFQGGVYFSSIAFDRLPKSETVISIGHLQLSSIR